MTKIIHDITVEGYRIKPDSISVGTAGSYGVEQVRFSFSAEWDNLSVDVIFTDAQKENNIIMQAVDKTALITIPWEATQYKGTGKMTVRGMSDGVNILSLQCDMDIENTLVMDETTNPTATDDVYQQMRVLMQDTKESADNAVTTANQLITKSEEVLTVSTENKNIVLEKAAEAGNYAQQTEARYNQVNTMYQDVLNKAMQVTSDKNTVISAKEEVTADKNYIDTKASEVSETATSGITQMNAMLAQAQDIANVQSYKLTLTGGWAASTLPGVYLYVIGKLAVLMGRLQSPDVAGLTPIANPICTLPEGIKPLYTMETDIISSAKVNNLPDIHVLQLGKSSGTLVPYADTYKATTTYSFSFTFLIE